MEKCGFGDVLIRQLSAGKTVSFFSDVLRQTCEPPLISLRIVSQRITYWFRWKVPVSVEDRAAFSARLSKYGVTLTK